MNEFLNPKSMVTPGMAGALVMFLSNAICFQFPEITPRWAALLLSFVLGGIVLAAAKLRYLPAAGFWIINSLVIFAVAAGSAGLAAKTTGKMAANAAMVAHLLIPSANAQTTPATSAAGKTKAEIQAQLEVANAQLAVQRQQLAEAQQLATIAAAQAKEAQAQHEAFEAQREQEMRKAKQAEKENASRFFKEW